MYKSQFFIHLQSTYRGALFLQRKSNIVLSKSRYNTVKGIISPPAVWRLTFTHFRRPVSGGMTPNYHIAPGDHPWFEHFSFLLPSSKCPLVVDHWQYFCCVHRRALLLPFSVEPFALFGLTLWLWVSL